MASSVLVCPLIHRTPALRVFIHNLQSHPGRIVRSLSVRSKWAGLGAQKGTPSAPQPMSNVCHRFPIISYEILLRKVLRRPSLVAVTEEGSRASPEPTISERTILGASGIYNSLISYGPRFGECSNDP